MPKQSNNDEAREFFLKLLKERRPDMQPRIMEALASVGTEKLKQEIEAEELSKENKK
jgi:hypothetical protein